MQEFSETQPSMAVNEVSISEMIAHTERIHQVIFLKEGTWRGFPGVLCASIAGGTGSVLGQGTKILHATRHSQINNRVENHQIILNTNK